MILQSADGRRFLDAGSGELTNSALATITVRKADMLSQAPLAIEFLRSGSCAVRVAEATARQLNQIRDALAQVPPDQAVWDLADLAERPPWDGNLSPVVTSCANLYTTSEGGDLLWELVSLLAYASVAGVDVSAID